MQPFLLILVVVLYVSVKLHIRLSLKKYTREKFSLYSLVVLLIVGAGVLIIIFSEDVFFYVVNHLLFNFDLKVSFASLNIYDKILIVLVYLIVCSLIIKVHKGWGGKVSKKQFMATVSSMKSRPYLFSDFNDFIFNSEIVQTSIPGEIQRAKNYLKEDNLLEALQILENLANECNVKDENLILLHSRLNEFNESRIKGVISYEDSIIQKNKLIQSILMESEKFLKNAHNNAPPSTG